MPTPIVSDFQTIATAEILDALVAAVEYARGSTAPLTWQRAIDAAYDYLLQVDTISYDVAAHAIRVESATTAGTFYEANGDCQCRAFTHGKGVCWHRAAARLVRRALEAQNAPRCELCGELAVLVGEQLTCPGCAPVDTDGAEVVALAAELYAEAQAAGDVWYSLDIAQAGARSRLPELAQFATTWDAANLSARIGAAQSAAMARAA